MHQKGLRMKESAPWERRLAWGVFAWLTSGILYVVIGKVIEYGR